MKQEDLQLTGGGKKENRRELDFYPTPQNATIALMNFLFEHDRMDSEMSIWEPACGEGAMSEVLNKYCKNIYSSDIRITGYGDGNKNYLNTKLDIQYDAIITNPPFAESQKFIEKATTESRIVCMLLKSQYWHAKSRYQLFLTSPPTYVLPLTWRPDFLEHEKKLGDKKGAPTMEVAWSVWIGSLGKKSTIYMPLIKPN